VTAEEEAVRKIFDAFARRDVEAILPLAHPEIELHLPTGRHAGREGPYLGYAGIRQYFADAAAVWDTLELRPATWRVDPPRVLITGRVWAHGRAGVVDSPAAWLWTFEEGLVVCGQVYDSEADARREFGEARVS
jgi:ketosteroid isomerase-like protein